MKAAASTGNSNCIHVERAGDGVALWESQYPQDVWTMTREEWWFLLAVVKGLVYAEGLKGELMDDDSVLVTLPRQRKRLLTTRQNLEVWVLAVKAGEFDELIPRPQSTMPMIVAWRI